MALSRREGHTENGVPGPVLANRVQLYQSHVDHQAKVVVEVLFGDINPFVLFPALLVFRSIGVGVPADGAHGIIGKKVLEEVQRGPSSRR